MRIQLYKADTKGDNIQYTLKNFKISQRSKLCHPFSMKNIFSSCQLWKLLQQDKFILKQIMFYLWVVLSMCIRQSLCLLLQSQRYNNITVSKKVISNEGGVLSID